MLGGLLLFMAVATTGFADGQKPAPADRTAYEAASQAAGKDAGAHVRLALWCESHGMTAERMKHLAAAAMYDPSDALARGLMGLVGVRGRWERPEEVNREAKDDPGRKALMEEYLRRRAKAADKPEDQWRLVTWCDQNGLKEQALAHAHVVLRLDPEREAAWKHLGYKKVRGRWVKPEQLEAERREAAEQERSDKHWRSLLVRWRSGLGAREKDRRATAEAGLASVTDARAVPMVWAVFATRGADDQKTAVRVLGQVDSPGASRALAILSVFGRSAQVRRTAIEVFERRDPRDFLGVLIGLVRDPLKYEVRPGATPRSVGQLFVEGESYDVLRQYVVDNGDGKFDRVTKLPPRLFGAGVPFDPYGAQNLAMLSQGAIWSGALAGANVQISGTPMPLAQLPQIGAAGNVSAHPAQHSGAQATVNAQIMAAEGLAAQRDIQIAQQMMLANEIIAVSRQQMSNDIQAIESYNADVRAVNDLAITALTNIAGTDLGDSHQAWQAWWSDQRGYSYTPPSSSEKPVYTDFVMNPIVLEHHACFEAGTPVHTLGGPKAIEAIQVGDQVLSQDVRTGKLAFTPVVAVFHNKPSATFRVNLDGRSIVATGIHRLWKAGRGWVMVRELKPGDVLRTLGGVVAVKSVEAERTQPVFNLRVAEGESYFVGTSGVLAHDNSTIDPVPEPFDAVGPLTAASPSSPTGPRRSMLGR